MSSAHGDSKAATSIPTTTENESTLFTTTNNLLVLLTSRLKERPHGQISLIQLPDVFLVKAHLERLVELEAKKVKHQETLIQLAMNRDEDGGKASKKRVKNTGTQATIIREAVAEEVNGKTADLQRCNANLEDRLKKAEKLLEISSNENKCLADKVGFLAAEFSKFVKAPKLDAQKSSIDALKPVEARLTHIEAKVEAETLEIEELRRRLGVADAGIEELWNTDHPEREVEARVTRIEEQVRTGTPGVEDLHIRLAVAETDIRNLWDNSKSSQESTYSNLTKLLGMQGDTFEKLAAIDQKAQERVTSSLQRQVGKIKTRLGNIAEVINNNSPRVDHLFEALIDDCRAIQTRLHLPRTESWNRATERMDKVEDED